MKKRSVLLILVLILAAAAAGVLLWLFGAFLPRWVTWTSTSITEDLDSDGTEETFLVKNRRFFVKRGDETLYSSPLLWRVSDLFTEDIDGDGYKEIIFIVWKHGSYGPHRPFWVEHDTIRFSQHVFIYRFRDGKVSSAWMSSDIGRKVKQSFFDENSRLHLIETNENETIWEWLDWGLTLYYEGPAEKTVSLLAVGDNLVHASIYERAFDPDSGQFDFSPIYEKVKEKISSYDLAVVNQETIFVDDPALRSDFPLFGTPASMGDALAEAGFDVILGANNHSYDKGDQGLNDTINFWKKKYPEKVLLGLHNTKEAAENIDYVFVNGIRIAMFNYTEMLTGYMLAKEEQYKIDLLENKDKLLADLRTAEKEADISICFLHTGDEYAAEPAERVKELADELINAGADLIICAHPHVLQPYETRKTPEGAEGLVFYSLGNFMSHQTDPRTIPGGAASLVIRKTSTEPAAITDVSLLPLICHFDGTTTQVYFLDDYTNDLAAAHTINRMQEQAAEAGEPAFTCESIKEKIEKLKQGA